MTSIAPMFGSSFGEPMPNLIDTYTFQFHGMERDELEYARDRFRRSARARRRVLWRLWWRNRVTGLLGAVVVYGVLAGVAWAMVRVLGAGILLQVVGPVLAIGVVILVWRTPTFPAFADRWAREEQRARDLYEMDRDSASYAAQLCRERWPS